MPRARESSYGLTAITLGEELKEQLDRIAGVEDGNRSKIVREALELYFKSLPESRQREQAGRDAAYLIALSRVLFVFRNALYRFDYPDMEDSPYDDILSAIEKMQDWIYQRMPADCSMRTSLQSPRLEEAINDLEAAETRLLRASSGEEWEKIVRRWKRLPIRKEQGKVRNDDSSDGS